MRNIARFIFWLMRWEVDDTTPEGVDKCVIVVGPHTSNWDFFIGRLAFMRYGVTGRYLIKKEAFVPVVGWFLRKIGGIPVDRSKKTNLTEEAVKLFNDNDSMYMVFTPEGTRERNDNWKKGFYYIALGAKVPIYICYFDFKNKKGGFHSAIMPSGDVDADILKIKTVMAQFEGKYPEKGVFVD